MQNVTAQLTQWLDAAGFTGAICSHDQMVYCFNYDQRWLLNIELAGASERLYFYGVLTRLTDTGRKQLSEYLLKQNLLGQATEGYSFALDDDDHVILWHGVAMTEINNSVGFQEVVFHFIEVADQWWHQLQAYGGDTSKTISTARSTEPLAIKV
ncbi:type III secretion system chaperone [Spartinivicinus ruber]|uniref:type III secretion system chaperone n=1 Tax=Spartinivicinus ruber TaxID=2683272 RepID=UPI0013D02AA5|nr:type III secretion system chaperone [Spartinivicinus ruber]